MWFTLQSVTCMGPGRRGDSKPSLHNSKRRSVRENINAPAQLHSKPTFHVMHPKQCKWSPPPPPPRIDVSGDTAWINFCKTGLFWEAEKMVAFHVLPPPPPQRGPAVEERGNDLLRLTSTPRKIKARKEGGRRHPNKLPHTITLVLGTHGSGIEFGSWASGQVSPVDRLMTERERERPARRAEPGEPAILCWGFLN